MSIILNRAKCIVCGDILESLTVHDYKRCKCGRSSNDGGTEYFHRSGPLQDMSIHSNLPYEELRRYLYRTGYGKPGAADYGIYRKTTFDKMTNEHLESSLVYKGVYPGSEHWLYLLQEKLYRIEREIRITE